MFGREDYLLKLQTKARFTLVKLRTNNNRLPITVGRYQNIPREERICDKCDVAMIGVEYHTVLVCNNQAITQLRYRYIPEYFWVTPNRYKFSLLLQSGNVAIINKLAYFLDEVFKMFR